MNPRTRSLAAVAILAIAALTFQRCASVAAGSDPIVVHAQQALEGADALYSDAMTYYFQPGVAVEMSASTQKIFEKIRTGYDGPYKALQSAIDTYRAGKAVAGSTNPADQQTALLLAENDLATLINQVIAVLPSSAATKSKLRAVTASGGK